MNTARTIREVEACETRSEAVAIVRSRLEEDGKPCGYDQADAWLAANLPLEKVYQTRIIYKIKQMFPEAFIWKAAAGPYSQGGIPDICCVINGSFYGFEVKRPFFGRATDLQKRTISRICGAGGHAFVVSRPWEVEAILQKELQARQK